MKKNTSRKGILRAAAVILLAAVICAAVSENVRKRKDPPALEVALFPYVPDMERFRTAVREGWEKRHPDVPLHFHDWDCYASDPGDELDVFVFDSIYLTGLAEKGYLLPFPEEKLENREDLLEFALAGCRSGGQLMAVPQLLCADFLYTRKSDAALSGVSDIITLHEILGDRKSRNILPEKNEGLLINLPDVLLTKTVMYLDALTDERQSYSEYSTLPDISPLSQETADRLRLLWDMGGTEQVSYWPEDNDTYIRARWFAEGRGRAYIGYSEAMAAMGAYADEIDLRLFSYGTEKNIPLFYTDAVGISAGISADKTELAYDLVNVLVSEEVLTRMSLPAEDGAPPQYLLTSRKSVYDDLAGEYPLYRRLKEITDSPENHVFRMGAEARSFLAQMEKALSEELSLEELPLEELSLEERSLDQ